MNFSRKPILRHLLMVGIILLSGVFLSACGKKDETEDSADTDTEVTEDVTEDEEEEEEEVEEESTEAETVGFDDFSEDTQTLGDSTDKGDADYTLASIEDTAMTGYHRFEFTLESDEEELPEIEAQLVSSGGYISVRLDRVTSDQSGIAYQASRDINEEGVLRLYHHVTAIATEEVYQIGISEDTIFYLHEGDDLSIILDVKYPGESETVSVEDEMDFTDGDVILEDTNTAGDARFVSYSWGVEGGVVKFTWSTSAVSGNPTPGTSAEFDSGADTITVTFTNLERDAVVGSDGEYEATLSGSISEVSATRTGDISTYVFSLTGEKEYRIYRSTSPNQVVLEVKL